MLIMNNLKQPLPLVRKKTFAEIRDRAALQYRRHIPLGSKDGQSLSPEEAERLRKHDAEAWTEKAPRWDGKDFPFTAHGEQGSVYDLPARVVTFLMEKYNRGVALCCEAEGDLILSSPKADEVPKGVKPIRLELDDPLRWSSESIRAVIDGQLVTVSAGLAEAPAPYDPRDIAVPVGAILGSKTGRASAAAAASANEPSLNRG